MKHVILVSFPREVTVGTLIFDNPCRGDIPRYNETIFRDLEQAMIMHPDLMDPSKFMIEPQKDRVTSFEAVEHLQQMSRFALENCRFKHGEMENCTWPRCFFTCLKSIRHADQL